MNMPVVRWDPFRELESFSGRLNQLLGRPVTPSRNDAEMFADWSPAVDVEETEQEYLLKADLPEVKKDHVKVGLESGVLTIEGDRQVRKGRDDEARPSNGAGVRQVRAPPGDADRRGSAEDRRRLQGRRADGSSAQVGGGAAASRGRQGRLRFDVQRICVEQHSFTGSLQAAGWLFSPASTSLRKSAADPGVLRAKCATGTPTPAARAAAHGTNSATCGLMRLDAWSLVLAAGAGRRLSVMTGGVPKQFWRPQGRTSLLEDTLNRLSPVVPAHRTVTIVDRSHQPFVTALANPDRLGEIVYQPENRGTAAGVLLGLLAVAARARDAIVVLTPSDHGVRRPEIYREGLRASINSVRREASGVVLLGVDGDCVHADYGWITPARVPRPNELVPVASFVEKPSAALAAELWVTGAVWSTMVLVARVSALINLYKRHLPGLYAVFAPAATLPNRDCRRYFDAVYPTLPPYDFSHDLLAPAAGLSLVVWPSTVGWSDLGTPERLRAWHGAPHVPLLVTHSAA